MNKTNRRQFLSDGAAVGAAAAAIHIVPRHVLGGSGKTAPSDKLNIAGIGVGGMGAGNLRNASSENIVALCDVDHRYAAGTFAAYPQAKRYRDFRMMFDSQKDIDAVIIATPDHTHALISMAALRAGKHVYCQKPLTHDVYEARKLTEAARKAKVATQMGIQGHSGEGIRRICEWIWDGAIGEVREVDAWCALTYYPWGHASWSTKWGRRPKDTPAVPKELDWDLWLGPAPKRAYHPAYHPRVWRAWWEYGSGMMGDRGAHTFDAIFWALKLPAPTSIDATSTGLNADIHPLASIVTYEFPARGKLPAVTVRWYDGLRPPRPAQLEPNRRMGDTEGGVIFKGTKGSLMCGTYGQGPRLIPETAMKAYKPPKPTLPRIGGGHEQDWVRACKSGKPAGANFDYSGPLTEICCLGNVAKRVDTRIEWDAAAMNVTNYPEANRYVRWPYREGWSL
jgi:predicted dehydrogenase